MTKEEAKKLGATHCDGLYNYYKVKGKHMQIFKDYGWVNIPNYFSTLIPL